MKTWIWAVALAIGLSLAASSAFATTWTVTGTRDGGGTISGSFDYDAGTDTYSAINITTTAGSLPGATYTAANVAFSNPTRLVAVTTGGADAGQPAMGLTFSAALSGAAGTRTFTAIEGTCSVGCGGLSGVSRSASGSANSAVPAAIPTMSEWAMILLGVLLAGGAALTIQRRRQGT